jgi:hypothetical protein
MPVAAAKPVAGAAAKPISVAKSNAGRSGAKPMPKFDESDVSEPNLSPSQFFRILDAKLDK